MTTTLTVRDETTAGESHDAITLEFLTEHITVRELIRERVFQEVKDYKRAAEAARSAASFVPPMPRKH